VQERLRAVRRLDDDVGLRERPVDVLRPLGADDDQNQVPITTRTGSSLVSR